MACTAPSMTIESSEHAVSTSANLSEEAALLRDRRRRHSFHTARKLSFDYDADAVFLKVGSLFSRPGFCIFLTIIRSNSFWQNWRGDWGGSSSTGNPTWFKLTPGYEEDMQPWKLSGILAPLRPGN